MAGRGPAPKPNAIEPRRGAKERHTLPPGEPWPTPEGDWHPKAVRWWQRMTSSPTAHLWDSPSDIDQLERGLAHAHRFWTKFEDGEDIQRVEEILIRVETVLWLNRAERARQGIKADIDGAPKAAVPVSSSRARLRAVGDDAVG